jgi:hypothetical protein
MPSNTRFNPRMVLYQLVAVQAVFYLSYISAGVFVSLLWGVPFSLNQFFDCSMVSFGTSWGRIITFGIWTAGLVVAFSLPRLIERTRKCFDFVFSLLCFHLIICWISNGFFMTYAWWIVYSVFGIVTTVAGEFLCLRIEKREIWVSSLPENRVGNE